MKIKKYISYSLFIASSIVALSSCSNDDFTETIFPDGVDHLDPESATYSLDKWANENFRAPYNLDFRYKMQDVGSDMDYNLVPAEYDKAVDMALVLKYFWFDAYKEVAGENFLKQYGPRIIHLIGSAAVNPQSGVDTDESVEGGLKVTLFRVNNLDATNAQSLNENYLEVIYRTSMHLLRQSKSYPTSFNLLSTGHYDDNNWQNKDLRMLNSLGFVSRRASSYSSQDVSETLAHYIVDTDEQWNTILENAARGWETAEVGEDGEAKNDATYYCFYYYENNEASSDKKYVDASDVRKEVDESGNVTYYHKTKNQKTPKQGVAPYTKQEDGSYLDANGAKVNSEGYLLDEFGLTIPVPIEVFAVVDNDKVDGVQVINNKLNILREWLKEGFGLDLDKLRNEVQKRQREFNIVELRKEINK